ncbi:hypothetical protein [Aurantiacibacter sp. MUD61]|uniref:hypothetical protein n=1 Tax=Aurantiacibacter sp. MUD61 TaxID=3009083 RepID=UPI0022F05C54|nr:hypothetical protein [Aurantiacibacter sp. MUD61]
MRHVQLLVQAIWLACVIGMLWFAFAPAEQGGLGGAGFHGLAFAVLGLLTPFAFPRLSLWLILIGLVVLGGGIEVVQTYTGMGRVGEWIDFYMDVIAASSGIMAAILLQALWHERRPEEPEVASEFDRSA